MSILACGPATTTEELGASIAEASGGTLVLEEVGLLTPDLQAELVSQIEAATREQFPRLLVTTRDDLRDQVRRDKFRSDLFYRLQVLEVRLPPLRDRMEDLPALVSYFVGQLAPERNLEVTREALARLSAHDWPGNLRELRNSIAYALTVNSGAGVIEAGDLPPYLGSSAAPREEEAVTAELIEAIDAWLDHLFQAGDELTYREISEALESTLIRRLLRRYDGKLARLASALQANRTTLRRRLQD